MARKDVHAEGFTIEPSRYRALMDTLDELAFRGASEESLVKRIAKAAGFTEVITAIERRRKYAKKQGLVRPAKPKAEGQPKPKRKRKPRTAQGGEGAVATT